MSINLQLPKLSDLEPRLTVIGIGGAGCNAVNNMIAAGLDGVEFVVANTDAQALTASSAEHRIQLGVNLTEGLGAGAKPEIGQAAAEEAIDEIRAQVSGSHMVFLAAGMGGGTGTGAASVIARVAREMGILVVGVVTKPFQFEGTRRMRLAEAGIEELKQNVDTLIVIPNQNLFRIANEKTTFAEAFVLADHVLYSGVACIVDLIIKEGLINLDFADVRTVMAGMGTAMMGTGEAAGERRATVAAEEAISNPLLDDISLAGARGLLLSITGGDDLTLFEVDEAASRVRSEVDGDATIIVGATFDKTLEDKIRVSIVASGMERTGELAMPPISQAVGGTIRNDGGAVGSDDGHYTAEGGQIPGSTYDGSGQRDHFGAEYGDENSDYPVDDANYADGSTHAPPPVPRAHETGELQRRLSMAFDDNPSETISDPSVNGVWHNRADVGDPKTVEDQDGFGYDQAARDDYGLDTRPRDFEPRRDGQTVNEQTDGRWSGSDDVVIEEGMPPLSRLVYGSRGGGSKESNHDNSGGGHHASVEFRAEQPPAGVRRTARRMPTVEDFPVVGQREYHARAKQTPPGQDHARESARQAPRRDEQNRHRPQNPQQTANRKRSFFERITWFARRKSDSRNAHEGAPQNVQQNFDGKPGARHDGRGIDETSQSRHDAHGREIQGLQDVEFPALIRRTRSS